MSDFNEQLRKLTDMRQYGYDGYYARKKQIAADIKRQRESAEKQAMAAAGVHSIWDTPYVEEDWKNPYFLDELEPQQTLQTQPESQNNKSIPTVSSEISQKTKYTNLSPENIGVETVALIAVKILSLGLISWWYYKFCRFIRAKNEKALSTGKRLFVGILGLPVFILFLVNLLGIAAIMPLGLFSIIAIISLILIFQYGKFCNNILLSEVFDINNHELLPTPTILKDSTKRKFPDLPKYTKRAFKMEKLLNIFKNKYFIISLLVISGVIGGIWIYRANSPYHQCISGMMDYVQNPKYKNNCRAAARIACQSQNPLIITGALKACTQE